MRHTRTVAKQINCARADNQYAKSVISYQAFQTSEAEEPTDNFRLEMSKFRKTQNRKCILSLVSHMLFAISVKDQMKYTTTLEKDQNETYLWHRTL